MSAEGEEGERAAGKPVLPTGFLISLALLVAGAWEATHAGAGDAVHFSYGGLTVRLGFLALGLLLLFPSAAGVALYLQRWGLLRKWWKKKPEGWE